MNKGGKKHKRTKKISYSTQFPKKKYDYEDYAYVLSMDGGQHCRLLMSNGIECKGVMRGSLKKKHIFVKRDSFVLVEKRDFQESKVDIRFKYEDDQVDELKSDINFKSLMSIVSKQQNNRYSNYSEEADDDDDTNIINDESEEDETEDFYSMMNRLTEEKNEINIDDI